MAFIPTVEQTVEGRHAVVKKRTLHAPHHSGALISLALRRQILETSTLPNGPMTTELLQCIEKCREPEWQLRRLHLWGHEAVPASVRAGDVRLSPATATRIIYRMDATTLYRSWQGSPLADCLSISFARGDPLNSLNLKVPLFNITKQIQGICETGVGGNVVRMRSSCKASPYTRHRQTPEPPPPKKKTPPEQNTGSVRDGCSKPKHKNKKKNKN